MSKSFYSIAESRRFVKEATVIYANVVLWMSYDGDDNEVANEDLIQINKRQARELIKNMTSKGDTIFCEFSYNRVLWL